LHLEDGTWVDVTTGIDTDADLIYGTVMVLSPFGVLEMLPWQVTIRIKDQEGPAPINLKGKGAIPVTIVSVGDFDATSVDPLSVAFGPDGAEATHGRGHEEDVDGDGDLDLVLHFRTQATGLAPGDETATLSGRTLDGKPIIGAAAIRLVGAVAKVVSEGTPETYELSQNRPNPFNAGTQIRYQLPEAGEVSLVIYNLMGQAIRTLDQGYRHPGYYEVAWDGRDGAGRVVSSGVYLYRFTSDGLRCSRRMLLLR